MAKEQNFLASFPLSSGQKALWFLYQLAPKSAAYNIAYALRLKPELNLSSLESAFQEVIDRHPSLRSSYQNYYGQPVQQTCQTWQTSIELTTTNDISQEYLDLWLAEKADLPFSLEDGEIIRACLLQRKLDRNSVELDEYILLIAAHHIATDFWSFEIILDELCLIYQNLEAGEKIAIAKPNNLYQDYVRQEKTRLDSSETELQWQYWQQKLAGGLPTLNLPLDKPRPPVQNYNGVSHYLTLDDKTTAEISKLAKQTNSTPQTIVLTAFQVLLKRYTSQDELLIGCSTVGRIDPEWENTVGHFVNPLVLRQSLAGNPPFVALLNRVRQTLIEASEYQGLPFSLLVEKLQLERDPSRSPLFQAALVWNRQRQSQNRHSANARKELIQDYLVREQRGAEFDLSLTLFESEGSLRGNWRYNSDLFNQETIERMAENWQALLRDLVANPELPISELSILSARERKLLTEWNNTATEFPDRESQHQSLHQLFEAQVAKTPDAIAVVFEDQQLTYRDLNLRANQLANYLLTIKQEPQQIVGICVERSLEMVAGLLGILKSGSSYVPLDPSYPLDRLAYMVENAKITILLTQEKLRETIPTDLGQKICLDTDWNKIAQEDSNNPEVTVTPEDLAYVIYTSGSTGNPKGVAISHRAICNYVFWMQAEFPLTATDKVLQKTPFSFDASVWEFYAPLLNGAQLVVAKAQKHRDPDYLIALIKEQQITVLQVVPTLLLILLEQQDFASCKSLKRVFSGGEALSLNLKDRFLATLTASLHNLYGPTETCIDSTFWTCERESDRHYVPIGRPLSNLQTYVLDPLLQPVPIGVTGELHVGGVGLAQGYLNNPQLTSEKFYWHDKIKSRLYKTGDLVRYASDGTLEYFGRIDNQVKIRGFRIELGEIESVLDSHPQVERSLVVATEEQTGNKRLVAYLEILANSSSSRDLSSRLSTRELRQYLKHKFPEFMVPSHFVLLDRLPLTPNGKVDRRNLPEPNSLDRAKFQSDNLASLIPPQDELEFQLTQIWQKVLGISSVGIDDSFFELGGHSLLAVLLFSEIEQKIGQKLPLAVLFRAPSIRELAEIIRNRGWSSSWTSLVPIKPSGSKRPFFCIHGAGGHVLNYYSLSSHLSPDQPFYALQAQGLDGADPIHENIPDMAAHYIKEMRELQPEGPYLLGGYCGGGKIALEMAQQLQQQGQKIGFLALFNTFNLPTNHNSNSPWQQLSEKVDFAIRDIGYHWGNLSLLKSRDKFVFLQERLRWAQRRWQTRFRAQGQFLPLTSLLKLHNRLIVDYIPETYSGRIDIFHTRRLNQADSDIRQGWANIATEGIEYHEIPAYFRGILVEPFVKELACQLESCLDQVEER